MSLTDTLAPECVVPAFRQDCIGIHPVQGEHSRIPAYGNDSNVSALLRSRIYPFKMLRNACMCIKAVYYIKQLRIFRCLLRKVCRTAAAQDHNIDLILPLLHICHRAYCCAFRQNRHCLRCASGKYCGQLHIRILPDCTLYTSSEISIA